MSRKKKQKAEPPGPAPVPDWVVTFTDMISLLVTFFVLLMTFSSLEEYDMVKVDAFLFGKRGVLDGQGQVIAEAPEKDLISETNVQRGAKQAHVRPAEELQESLEEMGQKQTDEHLALSFDDSPDGLVIEFGDAEAFAPGSSSIGPSLTRSLQELGRVLENYRHLVVVEGFTDAAFQPNRSFRTPEELSYARAVSAAETLLAESRVAPERIQVAGLGASSPRGANDSAAGRVKNRRVQLRVLSLARERPGVPGDGGR